MSSLTSASLGELRAIARAICEDDTFKKPLVDYLRAGSDLNPAGRQATDHFALIEQATSEELLKFQLGLCKNENTNQRLENYFQVLRYYKPTGVIDEAAEPSNPIKNATAKELQNAMLSLCEEDGFKKRVVTHLRLLRRSKLNGTTSVEADPDVLFNSASETELSAIGLAMSDGDEDVKNRVYESLRVISIFSNLDIPLFKCLKCQKSYHEENNTILSCRYHTGRLEKRMNEGVPALFSRWSCCNRGVHDAQCKIQKHQHK